MPMFSSNVAEYVNCLSDNGRFVEALSVLVDLVRDQERRKKFLLRRKLANCDKDFFETGFSRISSTCSAPVFDASELLAEEEEDDLEEFDDYEDDNSYDGPCRRKKRDLVTGESFQRFVSTVASTMIDVANKNPGFLIHINGSKNDSKRQRRHTASSGGE